jgi:hypothetical protein
MAGLGPPFHTLPQYDSKTLEHSVNFVSVKILVSDVGYPISVFGTILARDQIDYKCVYLFKCSRDCPQVIKSPVSIHIPPHLLNCCLLYYILFKSI